MTCYINRERLALACKDIQDDYTFLFDVLSTVLGDSEVNLNRIVNLLGRLTQIYLLKSSIYIYKTHDGIHFEKVSTELSVKITREMDNWIYRIDDQCRYAILANGSS